MDSLNPKSSCSSCLYTTEVEPDFIREENYAQDPRMIANKLFKTVVVLPPFFACPLQLMDDSILAVRRINDQLMMVERAFIDPNGLPGRPFYNHVVFAPSSSDNYASTAIAGLSDALAGIEDLPEEQQNQQWRTFEEHLAVCTHLLLTASKVLSDDLW